MDYHLGYNEKFPDGTYMHAELQKNGVNVFAVSESENNALVSAVHEFVKRGVSPTTSIGLKFDTEDEIKRAYDMLITEGLYAGRLDLCLGVFAVQMFWISMASIGICTYSQ